MATPKSTAPAARFTYGFYGSADAALHHISMFQNLAFPGKLPQNWGIAWGEAGAYTALRQPAYDPNGCGLVVVYNWTGPVRTPPAPPPPPAATVQDIKSAVQSYLTKAGNAFKTARTFVGTTAAAGYMDVHDFIDNNPISFGIVNFSLDAWGDITSGTTTIGLGVATFGLDATGFGIPASGLTAAASVGAASAFASSMALTAADGRDLFLHLTHKKGDNAITAYEDSPAYRHTEQVAVLVALFDPVREGIQMFRAPATLKTLAAQSDALKADKAASTAIADAANKTADQKAALAAKVQGLMNKPGHLPSTVDQVKLAMTQGAQAEAQALAAAAAARAAQAAKDIADLAKQAEDLEKDFKEYFELRVHFRNGTLLRDGAQNTWSMFNYIFESPWVHYPDNDAPPGLLDDALQALVPQSVRNWASTQFSNFMTVNIMAIGTVKPNR